MMTNTRVSTAHDCDRVKTIAGRQTRPFMANRLFNLMFFFTASLFHCRTVIQSVGLFLLFFLQLNRPTVVCSLLPLLTF